MTVNSNATTYIDCTVGGAYSNTCDQTKINVNKDYPTNPTNVNVTAICSGTFSCINMELNVYGAGLNNKATVDCDTAGSSTCQNVNVLCAFDNAMCEVTCKDTSSLSCASGSNKLECPNNGIDTTCNIIDEPNVGFDYLYTFLPSMSPTYIPSVSPTVPTTTPTNSSVSPTATTNSPSAAPSVSPTQPPSNSPSNSPSQPPSTAPSYSPSTNPSTSPSVAPSDSPSQPPSISPSISPSRSPSSPPSLSPSYTPSETPSNAPTYIPSSSPTQPPSISPTNSPSITPSISPTQPPSINPSISPTQPPSIAPSLTPSISPSTNPSISPSFSPSFTPSTAPSNIPSIAPSQPPSNIPSIAPSHPPTNTPSNNPSINPSISPSLIPTLAPSLSPTAFPHHNAFSRDIISNYVMVSDFGIDGFVFPAAIDKCMHYRFGQNNLYVIYECSDNETAKHTTYTDSSCSDEYENEEFYYNISTHDYYCKGEDTYIELELFPNNPCALASKSTIYMADGVCTSYTSSDNINNHMHYYTYCDEYTDDDNSIYSFVYFYYFDDECSLIGIDGRDLFQENQQNDQCKNTKAANGIFFSVGKCFDTTTLSPSTGTPTTIPPTLSPLEITTGESIGDVSGDESSLSGYDYSGYVVVGCVITFPTLVIVAGLPFHFKRKGTDLPGYITLFKFFSAVGDFYTDAIFALTLYGTRDEYEISNDLWPYALIFSFGPHILSIFVGLFFLTKWRQTRTKQWISAYAERFDKVIVILTILSGFFATTEIITSHLFHLDVLSFQIDTIERSRILNLK
eukprot:248758_1